MTRRLGSILNESRSVAETLRAASGRDRSAVVEDAPLRPNPVTQDEMDAGYVELF